MTQLGLVTIQRKRGRIAGFGRPSVPVEILWCGTNRPRRKHGRPVWPCVSCKSNSRTRGGNDQPLRRVVHLFGGNADFGIRLDLDPATRPDFIGDAFLPPFERDSFDDVVLDPPYYRMNRQEIIALLRASAWIARRYVWWFHTVWIATNRLMPLDHAWLIRVGDQCAVRTLQRFAVKEPKQRPLQPGEFTRGHALRYNRWLQAGAELPFTDFISIGPERAGGGQQTNKVRERKISAFGHSTPKAKIPLPGNSVFMGDWQ